MAKTRGDPKRSAFIETVLMADKLVRRPRPAKEGVLAYLGKPGHWQMFIHWTKHELVDNPARAGQKMPVKVEGMGRVELWRDGGEKPAGAMTDVVDGVTWYGFEGDFPHDATPEAARELMLKMYAKFGV